MNATPEQQPLLSLVARHAAARLPELRPADRATLLDGLALILPPAEAEQARLAADAIRAAEAAELIFSDVLSTL